MPAATRSGLVCTRAPEIEVLLLATRQHLTQGAANRVAELCQDETFRWGVLASAAIHHQVAPLVLTNVLRVGRVVDCAPPKVIERWKHLKLSNMLNKKQQANVARQIIEFFGSRGARVMLLKGAALDTVIYDEPWYTQSGDVDLLVEQRWADLSAEDRNALEMIWRRSSVEIDFMRHHDVDMNRVLDIDYARIWVDARAIAFLGAQAYIMSPEDMLLSACINLCRKAYRRLKGMMAVRDLIGAYPSLDWEKLARNARASGASCIVYGALSITDEVLGSHAPSGAVGALRLGALRRVTIDGLSRRLSAQFFQVPMQRHERAGVRLTSNALRLATYPLSHVRREALAHVKRYQEWKKPSRLNRLRRHERRGQTPG